MSTRKSRNSILVLATLGVYLGLVLVGTTSNLFAQDSRPANEVVINRRPLDDFVKYFRERAETSSFDLAKPFSIKCDGYLKNDGKFDPKKSRFIVAEGDPVLIDLAKRGIEAIGDSGFLIYLQTLKVERTLVSISQENKLMSLSLRSEAETKERARTIASGLRMYVQIGKSNTKDTDEKYLLENTSVTNEGTSFTVSLVIPSDKVKDLLLKK